METTTVSTRGQVVLPKRLREKHCWQTGQKLEVIDTGDGLLLKTRQTASWDDVVGCLSHLAAGKKPAPTDEQMHAAVRQMAVQRYRRGAAR
ncbi:MAG: AbrB/MazE/SpoVT family DNA-binding domain-containing protein [Burkholderiaceae bacterium]|jgi:AbrB family looped-hinge helix DNA binding protein|nr:AbrB/MazE/SpoVT family DNA-binding domain-containing protein [Burkholderiaceae bacterium]